MANPGKTRYEFGSDMKLLAWVWALVCFAVLITAALA